METSQHGCHNNQKQVSIIFFKQQHQLHHQVNLTSVDKRVHIDEMDFFRIEKKNKKLEVIVTACRPLEVNFSNFIHFPSFCIQSIHFVILIKIYLLLTEIHILILIRFYGQSSKDELDFLIIVSIFS